MPRLKPLNDVIFKKLFGEEANKPLLLGLLNAILPFAVADVRILEDRLTIERLTDKQGILDIKAFGVGEHNEKINVEVQLLNPYNFTPRTLFYWAKFFIEGVRSGDDYRVLVKTVTINILGFELLKEHTKYHSSYRLYEDATGQLLTDLMELHFIEMPKFASLSPDLSNPLHRWLLFLRQDTPEPILEEVKTMDPLIARADEQLRLLGADDEVVRLYEAREKHLFDEASRMKGSREAGREEGREEGRGEGKLEVARKLLAMGVLSHKDIAAATGVSEEALARLAAELKRS